MLQKYDIEELSPRQVATLLGCNKTTILRWLRKLGIHVRTRSEAQTGRHPSEKAKQRMSDAKRGEKSYLYGKHLPDKTRRRIGEAQRGEKNHNYGKHFSEETCKKMSKNHADMSGSKNPNYGKHSSEKTKQKQREAMKGRFVGENHPCWRGGKSFEPYCFKFNDAKKEEIRELHNRKCYLCGAEENGRKHCVHHTNYDKMQGCTTEDWNLLPLCMRCHNKTNHHRYYWFNLLYNHWAMNPEINFDMERLIW